MARGAQAAIPHAEEHRGEAPRAPGSPRRRRTRPDRRRPPRRGRFGRPGGRFDGAFDGFRAGKARAAVQRVLEGALPERSEMPVSARPLPQEPRALQGVYPRVLRASRGLDGRSSEGRQVQEDPQSQRSTRLAEAEDGGGGRVIGF